MGKDPGQSGGSAQTEVLAQLRAKAAALGDVERRAYGRLADDAQRAAKGAETKAEKVLQVATDWLVAISDASRTFPAVDKHYAPQRFAYFLDQTTRLDTQIRLDAQQASRKVGAKSGVKPLHTSALQVRDTLVRKLTGYAGQRPALLRNIADDVGTAETEGELELGLGRLAARTDGWLMQADPEEQVLLRSAGLTPALAQGARDAAAALKAGEVGATLAGKVRGTDSVLAGIAEGSVLFEMQEAMHAMDDARLEDPAVPRLIPTGSIARALGVFPAKKSAKEKAAIATKQPAAPTK